MDEGAVSVHRFLGADNFLLSNGALARAARHTRSNENILRKLRLLLPLADVF